MPSLNTEAGLRELDAHLAEFSYLGGETQASRSDFATYEVVGRSDLTQYPNISRWVRHLRSLKLKNPHRQWAQPSSPAASVFLAGGSVAGGKREVDVAASVDTKPDTTAKKSADTSAANEEKVKTKGKAKVAAPAAKVDRPLDDFMRLNIRIGRIQKVWPHPDADKLYCEEIDLGEETGPRTICSGLRHHLQEADLLGKLCVVLANLKTKNMRGVPSQGMVLCVTKADGKVELLAPKEGTGVGERVLVEGLGDQPADEQLNEKTGKAPLEVLKPGMCTTAECLAAYKGALWQTSAGPIGSTTIDGKIS
uniref:tRNA-binding domain-containing protein n=1 Tax=Noctiluca scintillans TaxID=2966 RepID=A0A7S1B0A8_NOCSC|mmetsp:Transcript_7664/g.20901  ORF Transcript_7664/g.20901 Transcript_7664/m.20901 type:complete len:308 (+) Transcript_7664:65-988(+)